jgi:hypothetical protein
MEHTETANSAASGQQAIYIDWAIAMAGEVAPTFAIREVSHGHGNGSPPPLISVF